MTIFLRQSTASQEIPLGYFIDSVDGNSEETGLTIAAASILIWKTGATTLAAKNSGDATHISNGIYYAVLDATDTNTIGPMVIFVHVTGALTVRLECVVLDEAVYDVLFGTTALSTYAAGAVASVTGAVGSVAAAVTVGTNNDKTGYGLADGAITAAKIGTGAIDADSIAADAVTKIQTGLAMAADLSTDAQLADAVLDEVIEGTLTVRQALMLVRAVLVGKSAGGGGATVTFRNIADTLDRVSATVDANGNRTAVTVNVT